MKKEIRAFPLYVLCLDLAIRLALEVIVIIASEALPLDFLPQLSHEKLEVYQKSIQFLTLSAKALAHFPKGYAELSDQLKRASLSVPLNIAEASGRTGSLDNARHFTIARGSALECGADCSSEIHLTILFKIAFMS